jgi:indole-3-glycerol phosphate synthase
MHILDEIALRKAWERAVLRSALGDGLRARSDLEFLPAPDVLERAEGYLADGGCERETRAFAAALQTDRLEVIAELKRRSPSAGSFGGWREPEPLARRYARGGAAAASVLTDVRYFDGRPGFLSRVRAAFPGPVLRKDFLADEQDLAVSAALGADAVLLIVAMLGDELADLLALCPAYGLEALVEVHDDAELDRALGAGATVIGVNNRDLRTFTVDLGTAERLAELVPEEAVLVAESGIGSEIDAARMRDAGADAVLVGESLVRGRANLDLLRVPKGG